MSYVKDYVEEGTRSGAGSAMNFAILTLSSSTYASVAEICGVSWVDLGVDGKFKYQVKITGTSNASESVEINTKKLSKNPACSELKGSSRLDLKEVYLKWEAKELNDWYGGYYILKSEDNKSFKRLNSTPLFHFTSELEKEKTVIDYVDTAVVEGETYYYKVEPINHFADVGIQSNVVEVYIQKRLEGNCIIEDVKSEKLVRIIEGRYEAKPDEQVREYVFMRSDKVDSGYVVLDQVKTSELAFEFQYEANKLTGDRHYFKVAAVSPDGDSAYSYPYYHFTLDQEPPGVPNNFKGEIDSLGIANLTWLPPADDDIRGYRIFRTNTLREEFIEVTKNLVKSTSFKDSLSLNNLTSEVYYCIRTVDLNHNNSPYSEPILLLKPDTIPPVAPLIRTYEVKEEGVLLTWNNSPSDDVEHQYLIRTLEFITDTLLVFKREARSYLDTTCRMGVNYAYRLIAADEALNAAVSNPVNVVYELGYRPAPKGIKGEVNREGKYISLSWKTIMEPIYAIQIYRAKNDGEFRLYKTIRENSSEYQDVGLSINNVYHYKIKVMYKSGKSSKMSDAISVVY